ncbi:MAG: C1 family peptidase, partial [Hungatella sp.]
MKRRRWYGLLVLLACLCLLPQAAKPDVSLSVREREPLKQKALPSAYDNRLIGRAPKVKNQGDLGTCWAFASLTAIESALLPEEAFDFSEDHMSISNSFHLKQDDGGEYSMAMAYLLAWQGPVLEQDDPYGDGSSPAGLSPVKHVQEIQILPSKDYDKIKEGV